MNTKILSYRFIKLFVLISTFFLVLSSCDIIDEIFGPGDDDITNTGNPGYNLIGTEVIGFTGGEIDLDSIIVNIPSGAFDENTEISISVGENNDGFDEYGISALYQISGLPSTINKPIKLSIKYHGTLEGDTLVAIGEMHYATSLDSSLYSYETDNASDSSGYLVYNLPVYSGLAKLSQPVDIYSNSGNINIIALGGYLKRLSSGGHFMLSYPLIASQQGALMGDHFENSYKVCENMGFDLSPRSFLTDPVHVVAKTLSKDDKNTSGWYSQYWPGKYTLSLWDLTAITNDETLRFLIDTGNFTINLNILSNDLELRTTCGHEFLHLVQNLYEFYTFIKPEQEWLEEATAVWIEAKYANVLNYLSSSLNNRELYPFVGWQNAGNENSNSEQGYGLAVIIKGIVERYGNGSIVKIFEKVKNGILPDNATDPVDAVLSVFNETVGNFWHGVLGAYVLGHYYGSQVNFRYLDDPVKYQQWNETVYWGTDKIDPVNNKLTYKLKYHDLSGKLFKIEPGDLSTLTTVPLSFTVDDAANCGILVCKYKAGSEITSIGEVFPGGSGVVILDDVKPVFDAGYDLVVLVSNSSHDKSKNYQGTNEVELTIELANDILNGKMEFNLDKAVTDLSSETSIKEILHFNGLNGKFINNRYEGSYNYQSLGRIYSGNVKITFIDNPESIDFHLNGQYTYESLFGLFGTVTFSYTVDYSGMPYEGIDPNSGQFVYSESGSAVQNGQFTWSETNWGGTNDESIDNLISYNCGADAYIRVEVDKRE